MGTNNSPWVLGISASHNGAVCLMHGSEIVVSIQEERLLRRKRWKIAGAQHTLALDYCFDYAGIKPRDLSMVVISSPMSVRTTLNNLRLNSYLQVELNKIETVTIPHHFAHAVGAFATSGFAESAVLVVDGLGSTSTELRPDELETIVSGFKEGWEMISIYSAAGTELRSLEKHVIDGFDWYNYNGVGMPWFRSLGSIFSSSAEQIFGESLDAGKVMGLAPYGKPSIPSEEFFEIINGEFVFYDKVPARFRHEERWPLHQAEYKDLACSAQLALEQALLYLVQRVSDLCPSQNLCYAGGVALNSVANEKMIQVSRFKHPYLMPAAEDSGPAIGAAYYGVWQLTQKNERRRLVHDAVGREYSAAEIRKTIAETPAVEIVDSDDVIADTVALLCQGNNIGWFQGKSELGPRALGQRSIICDPRRAEAKDLLNSKVKHREAFRPFAPVVLLEEAANWFDWGTGAGDSPHMLRVAKFHPEKLGVVPAVEHVDGTGRVQTVTKENNGRFYELVAKFHEQTGVPIILNTSFNVMGVPIVETPEDALFCLLSTGLDYCVLGDTIVKKREQVLLGANGAYVKPVKGVRPWALDKYDQREIEACRSQDIDVLASTHPEFSEIVGVYQNYFGVIGIRCEGENLTIAFKGFPARLERQPDGTFLAGGEIFNQSIVAFPLDDEGKSRRLILIPRHGEAWGEIAKEWLPLASWDPSLATFTRLPSDAERQREQVKFAGSYGAGDKRVEVCVRANGKLIITAPGQPDYELLPHKDTEFTLKNTPGYGVTFKLSNAGSEFDELILRQPNGTFVLSRIAAPVMIPVENVYSPLAGEYLVEQL